MGKPDFEGFARAVVEKWLEYDSAGIEGDELQELAEIHGILIKEPYSIERHGRGGADEWGMDEGENWFVPWWVRGK